MEDRNRFLLESLQLIGQTQGNAEQVYAFLQENIHKINGLPEIMPNIATQILAAEDEGRRECVALLGIFGCFIQDFPSGSRSVNLELAITSYQICTKIFTRNEDPSEWAAYQYNLGTAYRDRIEGVRTANIELAIDAFRAALEIFCNHQDFPVEWSKTQQNLGNAYLKRIEGNRKQNIEEAIQFFQAFLEVHNRSDSLGVWSKFHSDLLVTYRDWIQGERQENIEHAIHAFRAALDIYNRPDFPVEWARNQYILGIAYCARIEGNRRENLEQAIDAFRAALDIYSFSSSQIMSEILDFGAERRGLKSSPESLLLPKMNVDLAAYYSLKGFTCVGFPFERRMVQDDLEMACYDILEAECGENIEQATQPHQTALEFHSSQTFPVQQATVQNDLDDPDRGQKLQFFSESFNLITKAEANPERVYEFWRMNIDQIDVSLIQIIPDIASQLLKTAGKEEREWIASVFGEFGDLIQRFSWGNQRINLELAITSHQICASVSRNEYPRLWASTQYHLGNAYRNRIEGDRKKNIEQAIQAYRASLEVYTYQNFPLDWARTQNSLGYAYLNRIEGDRQENIEQAIHVHQTALEVYTRQNCPVDWAIVQYNVGVVYCHRIAGDRQENLELAIQAYRAALEVFTLENSPIQSVQWARTKTNLGDAYRHRIKGDYKENIEQAIQAYQDALEVFTQQNFPIEWEIVQNNLDNVYRDRQVRLFLQESLQLIANSQGETKIYEFWQMNIDQIDESLIQIIPDVASQILEAEDKENRVPIAKIFVELGYLLSYFPLGNRKINLELAIAIFQVCTTFVTRDESPSTWAWTQRNLGNAYVTRIAGDRRENIEQAIQFYQVALEVFTREGWADSWAGVQQALGYAYRNRIEGDREENIEQAIKFYRSALEVVTQENFSENWVFTQNSLGVAYRHRIAGDKKENLELAIQAFRAALEVTTRQNFPNEWAKTQTNLGNAYQDRIEGDRNENIEQAIQFRRAGLEVVTREDFPEHWAIIQASLGNAYRDRIEGDRNENIKQAIQFYRAALEVWQPELLPLDCLPTGSNLGILAFQEGDWNTAIEGFNQAITAVEISRNWATSDRRRQEIVNESIGIYEKMLQSCINANRLDLALQTVERVRSKRLVDLMAAPDLYPQGEIPEPVRLILKQIASTQEQMDNLRSGVESSVSDEMGTSNRAAAAPPTAEIQALEAQKQNFLDELSRYDAVSAQLIEINPPDVSQIQAELVDRPDVAILSFYTTTQDTHILIVRSDSIQCFTCPGQGGMQLQNWLYDQWVSPYINDSTNWRQNMPERLQQLAEKLELDRLVTENLQDVRELILIPHLYLHLIPFAALPLNGNQQYLGDSATQTLGDRFLLRYAPGCQVLKFCTDRAELPPLQQYGTVENATEDLPFAAIEGDAIAKIFQIQDTDRLRGSHQATIEQYKELLGRVNSVASCHHAQSRLDKPLESALLLANDRRVTLGDLLSPAWRFADLNDVFLSCCETGMTIPKTLTDELLTIGTGFLCAGARSVISSLWSVDDIATALLSQIYHRYRFQGDDRVVSLQKAQQEVRGLSGEQLKTLSEAEFIPALIAQQNQLEEHRKTALCQKQEAEENRYSELIDHLVKSQIDLEKYWEESLPFDHPVYWASFTCQGLR
jgi:CHAT domain-containing protein